MSLIDTLSGGVVDGARQALDLAGPQATTGAAIAAGGCATWLLWKVGNPHRGDRTTPVADAGSTITTGGITTLSYDGGAPRRVPTLTIHTPGAAIVTSSANHQSNIGPDGRTAYETVGVLAIRTAVDQFYSAVCADPVLSPYFHGVEMDQLKRHQALFLGQLWGGPVHFDAQRLGVAHRHLNVSSAAYWRVVGHLMAVLTNLAVPDWVCLFTLATLYDIRDRVIHEPQPCGTGDAPVTGAQDLPEHPTDDGDLPR